MPENLDADHIGLGEVVTRTVGVVCLLFSLLILVGKTGLACYRNPGSPIAPLPFIQILVCLISSLSIAIFPVYQIDTGLLQGISGFVIDWCRYVTILLMLTALVSQMYGLTRAHGNLLVQSCGLRITALILGVLTLSAALASPTAIIMGYPAGNLINLKQVALSASVVYGLLCIVVMITGLWVIKIIMALGFRAQGSSELGEAEQGSSRVLWSGSQASRGHAIQGQCAQATTSHGASEIQQPNKMGGMERTLHGQVKSEPRVQIRRLSLEVSRKVSQVMTGPRSNVSSSQPNISWLTGGSQMTPVTNGASVQSCRRSLVSPLSQVILTGFLGLPLAVLMVLDRAGIDLQGVPPDTLQVIINILTCTFQTSLAIVCFISPFYPVTNESIYPSTCCRPVQVQPAVTHQQITLVAEFLGSTRESSSIISSDFEPIPCYSPINLEDCRRNTVVARPSVPSRGANPTPKRGNRSESFSFQSRLSTVSYIADGTNAKVLQRRESGLERHLSNNLTDISSFTNCSLNESLENKAKK